MPAIAGHLKHKSFIMSTTNKHSHKDKSREPESTINRDIHRTAQQERFPIANLSKESREDSEINREEDSAREENLSNEAEGHSASRTTGHPAQDNAGDADIDNDIRREES
jgi:hypothetical protein